MFRLWVTLTVVVNLMSCSANSSRPKHHMANGRFQNVPKEPPPKGMGSFFVKGLKNFTVAPDVKLLGDHVIPEAEALAKFKAAKDKPSITWLGHSAFLIRLNNKVILTDPFLSTYASPVSFTGPKRYVPPGIRVENLPPIDYLLISHSHYDHMDMRTIQKLNAKENITVIAPLNYHDFFEGMGFKAIVELDWWKEFKESEIQFTALPAQHWANRGVWDRDKYLWCSWAIQTKEKSIYFAGDTGYEPSIFQKIGQKFPKGFQAALLPIGAYAPREAMKPQHVDPFEAVQIGLDIGADKMIAMHWGTVRLTHEPIEEPPVLFRLAGQKKAISKDRIKVLKIGETSIDF